MTTYLMGVDVGTTGSKAILIDVNGNEQASAVAEYPMYTPQPLWAEQDPEDWWTATVASVKRVLSKGGVEARQIAGVGLTGQMHGLVLLDAGGKALRPCIMYTPS